MLNPKHNLIKAEHTTKPKNEERLLLLGRLSSFSSVHRMLRL